MTNLTSIGALWRVQYYLGPCLSSQKSHENDRDNTARARTYLHKHVCVTNICFLFSKTNKPLRCFLLNISIATLTSFEYIYFDE